MKILAIDDEKIALEGLVDAIKKAEPSADIYSFKSPLKALDFYRENVCEVVFLDVQMRNMSGVQLAKEMKLINAKVNIVFATGYGDYREEAFDMHVSGYLLKPITEAKIRKELDCLRYPVVRTPQKRIQIRTFGNFELYIDGDPINFKYDKTKEMLAYLVDRNGTYCKNAEIMAALWQDQTHASYLSNMKKDLMDTLGKFGCREIIDSTRGKIRIRAEQVECDYFDWCQGKLCAINQYRGEYMAQYSWAEFTNSELDRKK